MASHIFPLIYHNHQEVGMAVRRCEMAPRALLFLPFLCITINTAVHSLEASPHSALHYLICHAKLQKQSSGQKMTFTEF